MPRKQQAKSSQSAKAHSQPLDPAVGCGYIRFSFVLPRDQFNTEVFWKLSEKSGAAPGMRNWTTIIGPRAVSAKYHVHFSGDIGRESVGLTVGYYGGVPEPGKKQPEPHSDSIMAWLSKMVRPEVEARVFADFSKPSKEWKSRFNLPFRVTMADKEVGINGVSMDLPANEYGAASALLLSSSDSVSVSMQLFRQLDLKKFKLSKEIKNADLALKIFLEKIA